MKKCFKCGKEKPLTEFYKHPRMADGHLSKCKECTKLDTKTNYHKRREYYVAYDKKRNKDERRRRYIASNYRQLRQTASDRYKSYREKNYLKNRARKIAKQRLDRLQNPEKYKARNAVNNAVRDGRLKKLPCEICGAAEKVQAHHHDYLKPLDVIWLCTRHHGEEHRIYK